jgi:hypothetical protein
MVWKSAKPGDPHILIPVDYIDDEIVYESRDTRPDYLMTGDGSGDRPYLIIVNADPMNWRMPADEMAGIAEEVYQGNKRRGLDQQRRDILADFRKGLEEKANALHKHR